MRMELIPDLLKEMRGRMSLSIPINTSHLRSSVPKIRTTLYIPIQENTVLQCDLVIIDSLDGALVADASSRNERHYLSNITVTCWTRHCTVFLTYTLPKRRIQWVGSTGIRFPSFRWSTWFVAFAVQKSSLLVDSKWNCLLEFAFAAIAQWLNGINDWSIQGGGHRHNRNGKGSLSHKKRRFKLGKGTLFSVVSERMGDPTNEKAGEE